MAEDEDEEALEKEIKAAIRDTGILLEYLARAPNSRLQSQFRDARDRTAPSMVIPIAPPCDDYSEFLNRLTDIRAQYAEKSIITESRIPASSHLSNKAFLLWSRDFLAGLASPATAETIRITNAFVKFRFPKVPKDENCESVENSDEYNRIAKDLVRTVKRSQRLDISVTVITLLLSMYALAGHQIVAARTEAWARYNDVNKRIEELQSHTVDSGEVAVGQTASNYIRDHPDFQLVNNKRPGERFAFCDNFVTLSPLGPEKLGFYGSALQFDICQERSRDRTELFAIAGELIAWQRTLTNPFQSLLGLHVPIPNREDTIKPKGNNFEMQPAAATTILPNTSLTDSSDANLTFNPNAARLSQSTLVPSQPEQWDEIASVLEDVAAAPSEIFGRSSAVAQELSNREKTCSDFGDGAVPGDLCALNLGEKIEYFGTIPDSIISCLTLYILPCLYGFLGSSVLTMRILRHNVDHHLVRLTDRATIVQNGILGLIAGSVVGLFAAYIATSGQSTGSLSISAIAFLAGYSIPRLFGFLDGLSSTVFQANEPRAAARPGTS